MESAPVVGFSKAQLRNQKMLERSPGPIYTAVSGVGKQVSSELHTPARYGFGSSSRFPLTGDELVDHMRSMHRIKGGKMSPGPRARRIILPSLDAEAAQE